MRHTIKLIWNNKGRNSILIIELVATFLMVFALFSIVTMFYLNYIEPVGFKYDDVWMIDATSPKDVGDGESVDQKILKILSEYDEIDHATMMAANTPFMLRYWYQYPVYNGIKEEVLSFDAEDDFKDVMGLNIIEGRWYDSRDNSSANRPAVINREMQRLYFKDESPIGKKLELIETDDVVIVGVIDDYKYGGQLTFTEPQIFIRKFYKEEVADLPYSNDRPHAFNNNYQSTAGTPIFIKLKKGVGKEFESKLVSSLNKQFPGANILIKSLTEMEAANTKLRLIPTIALAVIVGFLVLNIFIGLFGVLWYNISTRKSEIGLRRALGADTLTVYKQFISEMLIIGMMGLIPGLLIAVQFPLLNVFDLDSHIYMIGMGLAFMTVTLLVVVCAYLPSRQAALVNPSIALREE